MKIWGFFRVISSLTKRRFRNVGGWTGRGKHSWAGRTPSKRSKPK